MADTDRIIVVDEHDRPVGVKRRGDITGADIYRVSALWLTNPAGEILLAQRSLAKRKNPGLWGSAAAGTLDEGETYESNIYKEAEEEIGLRGLPFTFGPKTFITEPDRSRHFTQWFIGRADWPIEQFRLQVEEVDRIAWVSWSKLEAQIKHHPESYVASAPHWQHMFSS